MLDGAMNDVAVLGDHLANRAARQARGSRRRRAVRSSNDVRILLVGLFDLFVVRLSVVADHPAKYVFFCRPWNPASARGKLGCLLEVLRQGQTSQPLRLVPLRRRVEPVKQCIVMVRNDVVDAQPDPNRLRVVARDVGPAAPPLAANSSPYSPTSNMPGLLTTQIKASRADRVFRELTPPVRSFVA